MFRRVLNRNSDFSEEAAVPSSSSSSVSHRRHHSAGNQGDSLPPPSRMRSFTDRMTSRKRGRRDGTAVPGPTASAAAAVATQQQQHRQSNISGGGRSVVSTIADDLMSIQSTITVETTKTSYNENKKPIPTYSRVAESSTKNNSQVFCNPMNAMINLKAAHNDIVANQIYLKDLTINKNICSAFLALIRGDNKSWESMAVDILRQKARWESITFEECQNNIKPVTIRRPSRVILPQIHQQDQYLEVCISFIISLDNTAHLHLSNMIIQQAFTFQSITFAKHLLKLQFDLMDLSQTIGTLCHCLPQNTSLTTVIVSRCGLTDHQLAALLGSLPNQLIELRVFGNKCRMQGLAAAALLLQEHEKLQILDLSYQHLPSREEKKQQQEQVVNDDDEDDVFDISWLMAALMSNKTLITLDLDNTGIDDNQLRHIIQALCENSTLEEIMLNHNCITNDGVSALAARFQEMSGLRKISMYSNLFDTPTTAPPPTEITTPSVMSNSTQKRGNQHHAQQQQHDGGGTGPTIRIPTYSHNNNNHNHRNDEYGDEESYYDDYDDDGTINTAISSLADETVFQLMENNPAMLPANLEEEEPQAPFYFDHHNNNNNNSNKINNNGGGNNNNGGGGEEQHYFNDPNNDYDESVAPTEYDEISIDTEAEAALVYAGYNTSNPPLVPNGSSDDDESDDSMPPPIPGADFATNNTTSF
eukprot:scaffold3086_cov75-Cylindrotheca_fusiformis.AAC.5